MCSYTNCIQSNFSRWLVYCNDLKGLLQCFDLIGEEQHSDFIKVPTKSFKLLFVEVPAFQLHF